MAKPTRYAMARVRRPMVVDVMMMKMEGDDGRGRVGSKGLFSNLGEALDGDQRL